MSARPLTFVVGTGRSGSTALSRILNRHPDILSLNEFLASLSGQGQAALSAEPISGERFWRLLSDPNPLFDTMIRSGAPLPEFLYPRRPGRFSAQTAGIPALCLMVLPHLSEEPDQLLDELAAHVPNWPTRPAAQQYEAFFDLLCARFQRRVTVERSGYSLRWVPLLRRTFPHARFVHLFRDGPDCALSMSRHTGYRFIAVFREICERLRVDAIADLTEQQIQELPPDLAGLLADPFDPRLIFDRTMPVVRFGRLWSELIREGVGLLDEVPAVSRTTLSYEALLDAPHPELTRIADFVGVRPHPDWLEEGRAMLDQSRRGAAGRLTPQERAALEESCAVGRRALGIT